MVTKSKSEEYRQNETVWGNTIFFIFVMIFFPEYVIQMEHKEASKGLTFEHAILI